MAEQSGPRANTALSRAAAEQLLIQHLPTIQRLASSVARQHRLSADDSEEFAAMVRLRLIDRDYAVLRKFRGEATLQTFLTVVIQRMCHDFRDAQWGKWRASASTRRRGELAMRLERLTMRDGLTFHQACVVLETGHGSPVERDTLARIYDTLRPRTRPRPVNDDQLADVPAADPLPDRFLVDRDERKAVGGAVSALAGVLDTLPDQEWLLLRLRFADNLTVAAIAKRLQVDQKALYRHYVRVLAGLRRQLESRGIAGADLVPLLGWSSAASPELFARRSCRLAADRQTRRDRRPAVPDQAAALQHAEI